MNDDRDIVVGAWACPCGRYTARRRGAGVRTTIAWCPHCGRSAELLPIAPERVARPTLRLLLLRHTDARDVPFWSLRVATDQRIAHRIPERVFADLDEAITAAHTTARARRCTLELLDAHGEPLIFPDPSDRSST